VNNLENIVKKGLCLGCGICVYSDHVNETTYSKRKAQSIPLLTKLNKNDAVGYAVCPGKGYDIVSNSKALFETAKYDIELGHVYNQHAVCSNDKEILERASSGGIMSHLAIYLLEHKIVDRVLTTYFSYQTEPRTVCVLAKDRNEILQSQGSKYCPVDLSTALSEIKNSNYIVAVIGTPCQIAGIRNIQKIDPIFSKKIFITIANFCGGFKSYKNIKLISQRSGIDPRNINTFRFRGNGQPGSMLIGDKKGKIIEIPYPRYVGLNGLSKHLRCHLCVDATGELADIACGDAWLSRFLEDANPWSVIITRNRNAEDLIAKMIDLNLISVKEVSTDEIKYSQHQNLKSKKIRQKSRLIFYKLLGYTLPSFDGGYFDNKINLGLELKIYSKRKIKELLECLHIFNVIHRLLKK
jgi:coenzyme F420 hydrogenase subunit beta